MRHFIGTGVASGFQVWMTEMEPWPTALAATAAALGALLSAPAEAAAQEEQIVVPSGTRWRPGSPTAISRSFICEPHRVSYRGRYLPGSNDVGLGLRLVIDRLSVDGRAMPRWWIDFLNNVLAAYQSPPDVTAWCTGERIQLHLRQDRIAEIRSQAVDLPEPYR
jgi:hypothetical protein